MNLDELIKAAENPTPEILEEINKQVHGYLVKINICNGREYFRHGANSDYVECCLCGKKTDWFLYTNPKDREMFHSRLIPDYTKPENFWPLVEQSELTIKKFQNDEKWDVGIIVDLERGWEYIPLTAHQNPGIVVCLAYLKIKEQENDG